jgi:hypothetical protein
MNYSRYLTFFFLVLLALLNTAGRLSVASERLAEVNSKALTVEVNHGAVTWVGVYFLADRFGDQLGSHYYPNMNKAYWDFKAETLGQGKYVWFMVKKESECREENWNQLAAEALANTTYPGTGPGKDHIFARYPNFWPDGVESRHKQTEYDPYKNPWQSKPVLALSLCRKLRTFKKGELELDIAFFSERVSNHSEEMYKGGKERKFEAQSAALVDHAFSQRQDMKRKAEVNGKDDHSRKVSAHLFRPTDKISGPSLVTTGRFFVAERIADGDSSKPYFWKKDLPPLKPSSEPLPEQAKPSPILSPTPAFTLTAVPDRATQWAEKLKKGWAEAAMRDAETAARVANENARLRANSIENQMDELTRQFCATPDGPKSCSCRSKTPPRVCPR